MGSEFESGKSGGFCESQAVTVPSSKAPAAVSWEGRQLHSATGKAQRNRDVPSPGAAAVQALWQREMMVKEWRGGQSPWRVVRGWELQARTGVGVCAGGR